MTGERKLLLNLSRSIMITMLLSNTGCGSNQGNYAPVVKVDPARNAAKDIEFAIVEAGRSNKNILLDVGGEWCIWCHRLDAFIGGNKELNDYLQNNFIVVKINYNPENKNEKVLSQFPQVAGYPHIFVLDKQGTFLHSQNTNDLEFEKSYSLK